ncbi:hypothetical protein THAOC_16082 [Thalassiosira oceanica]|uniref:Uncharacterized protein n=1 Tax=Thalassiosira oceanica TaxID=159749 RepID=K0SB03_THAOC|nr:hypothetical protein THAOC_16082 [Thalassiosira oceanica]|eukprot:EJK63273.1 hypothetical protein THAOC_16082 [Thalassiosira oceanica]
MAEGKEDTCAVPGMGPSRIFLYAQRPRRLGERGRVENVGWEGTPTTARRARRVENVGWDGTPTTARRAWSCGKRRVGGDAHGGSKARRVENVGWGGCGRERGRPGSSSNGGPVGAVPGGGVAVMSSGNCPPHPRIAAGSVVCPGGAAPGGGFPRAVRHWPCGFLGEGVHQKPGVFRADAPSGVVIVEDPS